MIDVKIIYRRDEKVRNETRVAEKLYSYVFFRHIFVCLFFYATFPKKQKRSNNHGKGNTLQNLS